MKRFTVYPLKSVQITAIKLVWGNKILIALNYTYFLFCPFLRTTYFYILSVVLQTEKQINCGTV